MSQVRVRWKVFLIFEARFVVRIVRMMNFHFVDGEKCNNQNWWQNLSNLFWISVWIIKVDRGRNNDFALSKTHVIHYALLDLHSVHYSCQKCYSYLLYLSFVWDFGPLLLLFQDLFFELCFLIAFCPSIIRLRLLLCRVAWGDLWAQNWSARSPPRSWK